MNFHSSFWAIGGLGLWILILATPLLLYFVIAAFQIGQPKRGPDLDRMDEDEEDKGVEDKESEEKKAG